jgi:very-short-patch-repair endonuclease
MRYQLLKLKRGKSTKAERIFSELLKLLQIPFRTKVKINGREVDFLVNGKFAVEISGHEQDAERNIELLALGYVPAHFHNSEIKNNRETIITKLNDYKN